MFDTMGPGDVCAVEWSEEEYRLVKILAMEDGIVHVRLYADKFVDRPFEAGPDVVSHGLIHTSFGIPHLPLSADDFAAWLPGVVGHEDVRPEELEGYELWHEDYEARNKPGLFDDLRHLIGRR
jgi:hypothetical protein